MAFRSYKSFIIWRTVSTENTESNFKANKRNQKTIAFDARLDQKNQKKNLQMQLFLRV